MNGTIRRECRFCSTEFRVHPGFSDHEDKCDINPMNRPHIIGEAVAMGPLDGEIQ